MDPIVQSRKNYIEKLHLEFLKSNFHFLYEKSDTDYGIPDLFGIDNETYELKSRMYPRNSLKSSTQYAWWSLSRDQINLFEKRKDFSDKNYFWIFMLCYTDKNLGDYSNNICEDDISFRDVYVTPWNTYKSFDKGSNYINVGKNALVKKLSSIGSDDFVINEKIKLFLPEKVNLEFKEYF